MPHDPRTAVAGPVSTDLVWAAQLGDVPATLAVRPELRAAMRFLLEHHEIPVKVTEGGDRRARRKAILDALFAGTLTLDAAIAETERQLARADSPHHASNLVFASGWAKRLVHTHLGVFYTWAVLEYLLASGATQCFVPHALAESATSACSRLLAGRAHDAVVLRDRLIQSYVAKQPVRAPLVPNHPHCTHVVAPVRAGAV
ncbi:MAG: hypothetical protein H7138_14760 [Myxococcales bacterium]|nr:hypothetical protein [Myxococcales bacterium]